MVQPKYDPVQSLERIKLMMKYDPKHTLTENKQIVSEAPFVIPAVLLTWKALAAGLTALGIGVARSEWSTADSEEKLKLISSACDKNTPEVNRKTMNSPDWVEIAGLLRKSFTYSILGTGYGTDLEALRQALNELKSKGNFGDFCEVRKLFLPDKLEDEFIDELNTSEILEVVTAIEYLVAKSAGGNVRTRDEETANTSWWLDTFTCLEDTRSLKPGFVVSTDGYGNTMVPVEFKVKGTIKKFWMDQKGRILIGNDPSNTQQTGKKVSCVGRKVTLVSESITKKKSVREQAEFDFDINPVSDDLNPSTSGTGGTGGTGGSGGRSFTPCSGRYYQGCKSDVIKKVQGCIGAYPDGKWGPKTQIKITATFPQFSREFTDADVDTLCSGSGGQTLRGSDVGGTVNMIDVTDTNF